MQKSFYTLTAVALACGLSACGGKGKSSGNIPVAINVLALHSFSAENILNTQLLRDISTGLGTMTVADASGFNSAANLQELVYPLGQITICDSVTGHDSAEVTTFGFSSETGCSSLYESALDDGKQIGMSTPDLIAKYGVDGNTFNLVSDTDLAKLKAASANATAGSYNYAVVTWSALIGVKGSLTVNGQALHTRAAASDSDYHEHTVVVPDMTAGSAERAWFASPNGGMVAKFQQPLTVEAGKTYSLDVVLNPEGVLKGCNIGNDTNTTIRDGNYGIMVPMLPITAVLRETSDTLVRESYTIATSTAGFNFRLDLYYLKSDANKSILASTFTGLSTSTTTCDNNTDNRILRVVKGADGNYTFYASSSDGSKMMEGFARNAAGGNITVHTFNLSSYGGILGLPQGTADGASLTYAAPTTTELN